MNDDDFRAFLEDNGYIHIRRFADGWAAIFKYMFTWGVCTEVSFTGYGRRYCYASEEQAVKELDKMQSLDDVPGGWERRLPEPLYFTIVAVEGYPYAIGKHMTEREIIDHANFQCYTSRGVMPLDSPSSETLKTAVSIINDEGRKLEIFNVDTEAQAFLDRAKELGLGEEATFLTRQLGF